MANYEAYARSNYFKVKDMAAFTAALAQVDVEISPSDTDPELICLLASEGGWPNSVWLEDDESVAAEDRDITTVLSEHLADGWVAVLMEVGHEKLRYLVGYAIAVNNTGETVTITLDDIYEKARLLTPAATFDVTTTDY